MKKYLVMIFLFPILAKADASCEVAKWLYALQDTGRLHNCYIESYLNEENQIATIYVKDLFLCSRNYGGCPEGEFSLKFSGNCNLDRQENNSIESSYSYGYDIDSQKKRSYIQLKKDWRGRIVSLEIGIRDILSGKYENRVQCKTDMFGEE